MAILAKISAAPPKKSASVCRGKEATSTISISAAPCSGPSFTSNQAENGMRNALKVLYSFHTKEKPRWVEKSPESGGETGAGLAMNLHMPLSRKANEAIKLGLCIMLTSSIAMQMSWEIIPQGCRTGADNEKH